MCEHEGRSLDSLQAAVVLEGPVREAVHRMKYGDRPQLADDLARVVGALRADGAVLVPVPLEPRRRRQRGYNQAERLARAVGRTSGLPVVDGLRRRPVPGTQVGRSGAERRRALHGAFTWARPPAPAAVVLVDDVVTTGATLAECALACRTAGAGGVHGVALAVG
jgi:ComF family protein